MKKLTWCLVALLIYSNVSAQTDFLGQLKKKSENYFAKYKRAKLRLIFNQPKYSPGDTVKFASFYVSASNLQPIKGNEVVRLCLFDQKGTKQMTRVYTIENGFAMSELIVPKDLLPGNYKLVAFTDWMRNLDQSLFFQKELHIAGRNLIVKSESDTLTFFAEGGSLVAGVENNLAIHYSGSKDQVRVMIKELDKELSSLQLSKDSVSIFRFTPALKNYYAEITGSGETKKIQLPTVLASGVSLEANVSKMGTKLHLQKNTETKTSDLYLIIYNNSGLIYQSRVDLNQKSDVELPGDLVGGIAQVALVDNNYNLVATRVIYIGDPVASKNPLLIDGNSEEGISTRQLVKFNVSNKGASSVNATFSIVNADLLPPLQNQLSFEGDISNTFSLASQKVNAQTLNNYLITQTCPWFDWEKLVKDDGAAVKFKRQSYPYFSGTAKYSKDGSSVRDSTLIMFFLQKNLIGYETQTTNNGHFSFPELVNVTTQDQFFYASTYKGNDTEDIDITVDDPDANISFKATPWTFDDEPDSYAAYSANVKAINKSYSFFSKKKMQLDSVNNPNKSMEQELGGADITLDMSKYLLLPTMDEVLREIVKAVEYRKMKNRHVVRVVTTANRMRDWNHTGPLYVIDGQITKDPNHFFGLKPADVISIKVVRDSRKLMNIGQLGINGVILVKTKTQAGFREKNLLAFTGRLPASQETKLKSIEANLPAFNPCLYWQPSLKLTGGGTTEIKFNTSDDVGNFALLIYGFTENGTPFNHVQPFAVKHSGN